MRVGASGAAPATTRAATAARRQRQARALGRREQRGTGAHQGAGELAHRTQRIGAEPAASSPRPRPTRAGGRQSSARQGRKRKGCSPSWHQAEEDWKRGTQVPDELGALLCREHSFHDLAKQQGVPDAVVKAMAGRAGTDVAARGQDKHLHYSRGVTVEEMRQASMALMELVPTEPAEVQR